LLLILSHYFDLSIVSYYDLKKGHTSHAVSVVFETNVKQH